MHVHCRLPSECLASFEPPRKLVAASQDKEKRVFEELLARPCWHRMKEGGLNQVAVMVQKVMAEKAEVEAELQGLARTVRMWILMELFQ